MTEEDKISKKSKNESLDEIKSILPPEVLNIQQKITTDDLKEKFPNLHSEMTEKKMKMKIDDVEEDFSRSGEVDQASESTDLFRNFEPSTIDFIRRAQTEKEAEEIIHFELKQGNISTEEANNLLDQLSQKGVRSFGPIKTTDHYFRKAAEVRNRKIIEKRYSIPK